MVNCAICKCNKDKIGKSRTFHRFPYDEDTCHKWTQAVNREGWVPREHDRVCSAHFNKDDFDRTGCTVRLWKGAIPNPLSEISTEVRDDSQTAGEFESIFIVTDVKNDSQHYLNETNREFEIDFIVSDLRNDSQQYHLSETTGEFQSSNSATQCNKSSAELVRSVYHDHLYPIVDSPRKLKRKLTDIQLQNKQLKQRLKLANRKIGRLRKKVQRLRKLPKV